jgi:hypothetical protein
MHSRRRTAAAENRYRVLLRDGSMQKGTPASLRKPRSLEAPVAANDAPRLRTNWMSGLLEQRLRSVHSGTEIPLADCRDCRVVELIATATNRL